MPLDHQASEGTTPLRRQIGEYSGVDNHQGGLGRGSRRHVDHEIHKIALHHGRKVPPSDLDRCSQAGQALPLIGPDTAFQPSRGFVILNVDGMEVDAATPDNRGKVGRDGHRPLRPAREPNRRCGIAHELHLVVAIGVSIG